MANFIKLQAKRKREQAKLDKRQAKDQQRALRKTERSGSVTDAPSAVSTPPVNPRPAAVAVAERKPLTLAEAVDRWKNTKVAKPKSASN